MFRFEPGLKVYLHREPVDGGKAINGLALLVANQARIAAVISIPAMQAATFGRDVGDLLKERLTFDEALASPDRPVAIRQRLKIYRRALLNEMDASKVL